MDGAGAYLDYNATAPLRPSVRDAMVQAFAAPGNPSSVHGYGRAARRLMEESREAVAALVGAPAEAVIFTSGGTEANALAMTGWRCARRVVSAIEHPSILKYGDGPTVAVTADGRIDAAALGSLLSRLDGPALVAAMLVNNETGVIQPIDDIVAVAKAHGALVHCDAVQAAGRMPVDIVRLGVDSLALSAHKLGGPTGVGALVLARTDVDLEPLIRGGGQERSYRGGTENLAGIAGFAAAARAVAADAAAETGRVAALRDRLEAEVRSLAPDAVLFGALAPRVANTSCLALPGVAAQTLLMGLDLAGVAVSSGSACSSGKVAPSHVLTAMGAGRLAAGAIRISLGWASDDADVDRFLSAFAALVRRLRPAEVAGV
jgi:cysteine desulfurase